MRRANLLLINPRACKPANARLPLSLLALGAVLEGRHDYRVVDGNIDPDVTRTILRTLARDRVDAIGVTVMPGPQVVQAVAIASAIRDARPNIPIIWGGYFPTMYSEAAINARYVDYVVRGPGEDTLLELLEILRDAGAPTPWSSGPASLEGVQGLTWKRDGEVVHNPDRRLPSRLERPTLPYSRVPSVARYQPRTYLGDRTGVHQAALGCRYRCTFCGVVSMFDGKTRIEPMTQVREHLFALRDRYGATAMQFYDNNFFDTEEQSVALLEVLADARLPYWCFSRADALVKFSPATWALVRRSRLRMTYIGAEAIDDETLRRMRKGTRVEHTFEAAARCREHGIIPELSFILGGPENPVEDVERTCTFVRTLKQRCPEAEIVLYFYTPTPQRDPEAVRRDPTGLHLPQQKQYGPDGPPLPTTPEEWSDPKWIDYVCHTDAPWLPAPTRQRVRDFAQVLACRFPTAQDVRTPRWGKSVLRELARWRYATETYARPWELTVARRLIPLKDPRVEGL